MIRLEHTIALLKEKHSVWEMPGLHFQICVLHGQEIDVNGSGYSYICITTFAPANSHFTTIWDANFKL